MAVEWTIGKGGGTSVPPTSAPKRKVPHIAKQRKKDDMTDAAKRGIDQWNLMIDVLKENNLMEDQ